MGQSTSVAQLTGKIQHAGENLREARRPAINAAALAAKQTMMAAPGAPKFMRGVGRKGAKTGVRYTVFGTDKAVVRWYGPAHLLNNPTQAHDIYPRKRRGRGGKKAITVGGQPYAKAHVRGTHGRAFFQHSKQPTLKAASNAYNKTIRAAVAAPFR